MPFSPCCLVMITSSKHSFVRYQASLHWTIAPTSQGMDWFFFSDLVMDQSIRKSLAGSVMDVSIGGDFRLLVAGFRQHWWNLDCIVGGLTALLEVCDSIGKGLTALVERNRGGHRMLKMVNGINLLRGLRVCNGSCFFILCSLSRKGLTGSGSALRENLNHVDSISTSLIQFHFQLAKKLLDVKWGRFGRKYFMMMQSFYAIILILFMEGNVENHQDCRYRGKFNNTSIFVSLSVCSRKSGL